MDRLPRVAITHGDINGIGYELILKALAEPEILELMTPIVYGSKMIAAVHAEMIGSEVKLNHVASAADAQENRLNFVEVSAESAPVKVGKHTAESAVMASKALAKAMGEYAENAFDVLVLAPSEEDEISPIVDFSREKLGVSGLMPMDVLANDTLAVASVAGNVDAEKARQVVSVDDIVERGTSLFNALRRDLRMENPRIALISLSDDADLYATAIAKMKENGVYAFGPYSAEDMFDGGQFVHFDGVLGMYDAQVTEPFKALYGYNMSHLIAGLPFIITAPVQGTSFDIAGKGVADETSMRNAIYMAIDAYRSSYFFDLAHENPLKKIYHERREDGDKARFAVRRDFRSKEGFESRGEGKNENKE